MGSSGGECPFPCAALGISARETLAEGLNIRYVGSDEETFLRGRSLLLRALKAAVDLVKDGAALPQSIEPERLWSRQVFVVHGHDESATNNLESFLTETGLEPIVLHRQPD